MIPSATGRRGSTPNPTGVYANREETIERLWTFLAGINTQSFTMGVGAVNGEVLVADASGVGTWQALSALTATFTSPLTITSASAIPRLIFDYTGAPSAYAQTLSPQSGGAGTVSLPISTCTLPGLQLANTFSAAQTIAPTSGTPLMLTPPAGGKALASDYTETAQTASGNGIWSLSPTLSSAGTVGSQTMLRIAPTVSNLGIFQGFRGIQVLPTVSGTALFSAFAADFVMTVGGTSNVSTARGITGQMNLNTTGTATTVDGLLFAIIGGVGHGAVTTMRGIHLSLDTQANVTAFTQINLSAPGINAGTTTTLTDIRIPDAIGAGSVTTQIGLHITALTKATTNRPILSEGGDSIHVGRFHFGGNVAPTANVHLAAGTATASTAPLKLTSGTSLTAAEAGAVEFTTDDLFFTITTGTARKRLAITDPVGGLTSGRVPFATTNGRITDDPDLTFATDTLTATKIVGTTTIKVGTAAGYLSSDGSTGATGSFTTTDLKTVTVKDGIITAIV